MTRETPAISIDDLPASLADVGEVFGVGVAMALIRDFGGCELALPRNMAADHPVVKTLGAETAAALSNHLGGMRIYVPHCRPARSVRADVLAMSEAGHKRAEIARRLGISERHVSRVVNSAGDPRQFSLFGDENP